MWGACASKACDHRRMLWIGWVMRLGSAIRSPTLLLVDERIGVVFSSHCLGRRCCKLFCDGGVSEAEGAGCGWLFWGSTEGCRGSCTRLATASWALPKHLKPIETEMAGMLTALRFVREVVREGGILGPSGQLGRRPHISFDVDLMTAASRPQMWPAAVASRWMRLRAEHPGGAHRDVRPADSRRRGRPSDGIAQAGRPHSRPRLSD